MISSLQRIRLLLIGLTLAIAAGVKPAYSQSIVPAPDGTNTVVTPNGNRLDIGGGRLSSDQANLFHSFTRFNLDASQTANFLSQPSIHNILGRITGGDASLINGLIQVTGGNANLFLMNPAGIIFGTGASLNVPASFTATTATSIGFGNNWFNATGVNDYATLVGEPNTVAFLSSSPGTIINAGNLAVGTGQNLTLLGGTVVNTRQLNAPAGQITVAAVPGESLVRLSQPGFLLSLEVSSSSLPPNPNSPLPTPLSLPQLLTGGNVSQAAGLTVKSDGTVHLTGTGVEIPTNTGTTIVSGMLNTSGTVLGQTGGKVQVLGDKVGLIDAHINASGTNGGGTVLIGGDYQGRGTVPNASRTYVSNNSVINADSLLNGNGGRVIVWSNEATGYYGNITARGGTQAGNGGLVEVSGKQALDFKGTTNTSATNGTNGTTLLDPRDIIIESDDELPEDNAQLSNNLILFAQGGSDTDFQIDDTALTTLTGNIVLQAQRDIIVLHPTPDRYTGYYLPLTFTNQKLGDTITFQAGRNIQVDRVIKTAGGSINWSAIGSINISDIGTYGGNITLNGETLNIGTIDADQLDLDFDQGITGEINLNATGDIRILNAFARSSSGNPPGRINITSSAGNIKIEYGLRTNSDGIVAINAAGNFTASQSMFPKGYQGEVRFNVGGRILGERQSYENPVTLLRDTVFGNEETLSITFSNTLSVGNHALTITAGEIDFLGGANSVTGTGTVQFQPATTAQARPIDLSYEYFMCLFYNQQLYNLAYLRATNPQVAAAMTPRVCNCNFRPFIPGRTPNQNIVIGGLQDNSDFEILHLSDRDVAALQNGFSSITIGRADGTGNITFASPVTFYDPVLIQAPAGAGSISSADGTITGLDNASITLLANQNITTGDIKSTSGITLISRSGEINTNGMLNSSSPSGRGGNITLEAPNKITAQLNANGLLQGGDITLTSNEIDLNFTSSNGGNLLLQPFTPSQAIVIGQTEDNPDVLNLTNTDITALQNGFNSITIGRMDGSGQIKLDGDLTFSDPVTIQTPTGSGAIAATGSITGLDNASITLLANQNITTNNITANPGITLRSNTGSISTQHLNTSGINRGGNVSLNAEQDIQASSINAQGGANGTAGNVDITTNRFFRATDTFNDQNGVSTSISAAGGTSGGAITIQHGGGVAKTPFVVGNATVNGTAGAISNGRDAIAPVQSFRQSFTQGNIRILTFPGLTLQQQNQIATVLQAGSASSRTEKETTLEIPLDESPSPLKIDIPSDNYEYSSGQSAETFLNHL